jgi:Na+/melibiose symporter-like transporter
VGTAAAGAVLAAVPGPRGFAACFAIAAALAVLAYAFFAATRHDWAGFTAARGATGFWREAVALVRTSAPFRGYLLARVCMTATVASTGFYAIHAVEAFGLTAAQASLLSIAIVFVPNLTAASWGLLADRVGNRRVQVPAVAAAAVANLALAATPPLPVYVGLLVVAGFVNVVNQLVDNKFLMELDPARCGTLLGALNLALTPWLLVLPLGAGVLAELAGVGAVFAATGAALGLAVALLLALDRPPPA